MEHYLVRFSFRLSQPLYGFYNIRSLSEAWKHVLLSEETMQ
jgi:hypothetical protein